MGTLSEYFTNLSELLLSELARFKQDAAAGAPRDFFESKVLRPLLPGGIGLGPGEIVDVKDRRAGPFDIVGCSETYPSFGQGRAHYFLNDGVMFCLNVKDWRQADLTQFGQAAAALKKLERKSAYPVFCGAVSSTPLSVDEVMEFLRGSSGAEVDGVVSIGHNAVLRNFQGWYGAPERLPFVAERQGPEALKAFVFFLRRLAHAWAGWKFGLGDYQHL